MISVCLVFKNSTFAPTLLGRNIEKELDKVNH